ncbi:MAG: FAD:protein FMN transferase [Acidobacteria bacterium]|nr:FAD:protein FMN transferase [Acidobacteriota bacterium]
MLVVPPPALLTPAPSPARGTLDREALSMGTRLSLHLEGAGDLAAASEAALQEAARIEGACSTWNPDSVWSRLNAQGHAEMDPEWAALLAQAKAWSPRMEGAFDPVLGRLVEAWGARMGGRVPSAEELANARTASGESHLMVQGDSVSLSGGAWIEEGGFVKGYALDRMKAKLVAAGVRFGWLNFGGQILAWGAPRAVSVADPLDRTRPRIALKLRDASLACSGDAVRGKHLLDPRSGRPCDPWGEVAVVAPSGFDADVLSKLFVLGPDQGLTWADAHGVAAAFLPNTGAPRLSRAFLALHPVLIPFPTRSPE